MKITSSHFRIFISLFLIMLMPLPAVALNKDVRIKKILCISSYGSENHYVQEELLSFVRDAGRDDTSFMPILELMDCRSLNRVSQWQESMKTILERNQDPDIIVLLGNEAAITYFSMSEEKYRKIPLYVLQCNSMLACLSMPYGITSVQAGTSAGQSDISLVLVSSSVVIQK